jgi:hypothetical protein
MSGERSWDRIKATQRVATNSLLLNSRRRIVLWKTECIGLRYTVPPFPISRAVGTKKSHCKKRAFLVLLGIFSAESHFETLRDLWISQARHSLSDVHLKNQQFVLRFVGSFTKIAHGFDSETY